MKIQCPVKIIVVHLNINSIRNKFDVLSFIIDTNESFPSVQFRLKGFCTPYRLDRNSKEGGLLLHFHEDIPARFLNGGSTCNVETKSVELI